MPSSGQQLTSTCPLCGAANHCEQAIGSGEPCWCAAVQLSESQRDALAQLPEQGRCLCRSCLQQVNGADHAR